MVVVVAKEKVSSALPSEMTDAEAQKQYGISKILEDLKRLLLVMTVKAICKKQGCKEMVAQSIDWRFLFLAPGKAFKKCQHLTLELAEWESPGMGMSVSIRLRRKGETVTVC